MVCRLCLIDAEESIAIFSEEKIQQYITKFLQLQLSPDDPVSKEICARCWHQLDNFQNFCLEVEQAQKTLNASLSESKENNKLSDNEWSQFALETSSTAPNNLDHFKKDLEEESDDDCRDNDEALYCPNVEISSVEVPNEQTLESTSPTCAPETNENVPKRRLTRRSAIQNYQCDDIPGMEPVKKKRGRPKKREVDISNKEVETPDGELTIPKQESIESKEDISDLNNITPEPDGKKKRGRPRKSDQGPPKEKRPRSEQCKKMLQTAKEFDEIIQKNMNLSCNMCQVRLIDFAELKRHFRAVHKRRGYAVCCNKRLFKRGLVVDHINVHNNPEHFKCTKCGKILADRMCLRNHDLLFHQTDEEKTFKCPYCPKKYAKQYLLDHHSVKHVPQDECTFFCAECGKGFPTNSTLTKHINQIHSTMYDKMCEICAKLIRGNANFDRHMEEHEGIVQPQVQCTLCGSWLKDKNSLRKHMYKHDGKTYTCNACGKIAPTKSALQSHKRYVHDLSPKFHCTYCDKSFKKAVNLKEHMTTHTGEVLYTCPHCPKTFNSKANMHSHRKKKHREEWEANRRYPKKEMKTEVT
ncbi:transcription factor grauzone-like [Episyrphus balteatus]|uniref:transcription factor grauzone-like n=1 Tax=Episyrphus balteatus TaxID=286459 RepID=UPI002484E98C|nr:transcription factor grauzone-like [Episyrphus balteatus]